MNHGAAPAWRYVAAALLLLGLAGYMLLTGELAIDKQGSMKITRDAHPFVYCP